MNTWFRSALFAGAALAVLGLAPQAFAEHFGGHVKGGANTAPAILTQFPSCPLPDVDVATICTDLAVEFFTLGDGSRCLCPGLGLTIIDCRVNDPKFFLENCAGEPLFGGGTISTTPSGPSSCRTIIGVFGGTPVSYEVCSALF